MTGRRGSEQDIKLIKKKVTSFLESSDFILWTTVVPEINDLMAKVFFSSPLVSN